ncbi:MAG: DUF3087 domain-containing protein [Gammaproteobacteria bacterium]|nr:DUF3087 domain-containing protein [Gammaproteobacteria bacterium]
MKLRTINKTRYRKNLNLLLVAVVGAFMLIALLISTLLIALIGSQFDDNFSLNVAGVIIGGLTILALLNHFKHHPLMTEIYYVWLLKQQLNYINRKITKIEQQVQQHNPDAMVSLNFYYQGSMQLWQLDDNTITIDSLKRKIAQLDQVLTDCNVSVSTDDYQQSMLAQF